MSKRIPLITFTFDDGTLDHYTHAAPILEKYGYRGIFCITTGYVDGGADWKWPCMEGWMVKDLMERGHEIASHAAQHPNMRKLLLDKGRGAVLDELTNSYVAIYEMTGHYPQWFCYPYNCGCPMVSRLARQVGMEPFNPIGRPNLGGYKWPSEGLEKVKAIEAIVFSGAKKIDLMFHGCLPGEGWNSFCQPNDFEFIVQQVKRLEQEGRVQVAKYSQAHKIKKGFLFNIYDCIICALWPWAYRVVEQFRHL